MITLGTHDTGVSEAVRRTYSETVASVTRVNPSDVADGPDKLEFHPHQPDDEQPMSVSEVQQALKELGFFPGGQVDGICGYRTLSAIRLFQEYVRSVEGLASVPDGRLGPNAQKHLNRWLEHRPPVAWAPMIDAWRAGDFASSEYGGWLSLGAKVRAKYEADPTRMLRMVEGFPHQTDTRRLADWDFDPGVMHLIGIRRDEFSGKFDDIFVFLIKGMVFKFQGSTEPGSSSHPNGRPFLVQGQHDYHFGWHRKQYLALRPRHLDRGVLVVRSKNDTRLDEGDLDAGLSGNASINIHWGGKGITFDVNNWSEGCQVINGTLYLDHANELVDCSSFVARNNSAVGGSKTRGAYNVLLDLAAALSSDLSSDIVRYLLLSEADLELDPALARGLGDARSAAMSALK